MFGCAGSSLLHWLFSSCGEWEYSPVVARRLLIAVASLAAEHRLQGARASVVVAHELVEAAPSLQSTGSIVAVHGLSCAVAHGGLPRSGFEPVSAALAGRFFTTKPPGKPSTLFFNGQAGLESGFLRCYSSFNWEGKPSTGQYICKQALSKNPLKEVWGLPIDFLKSLPSFLSRMRLASLQATSSTWACLMDVRALDPPHLGSQASSGSDCRGGELAQGRFPHQLCWSGNWRGCHQVPLNSFLKCADLNLLSFRSSLSNHNCILNSHLYKLQMSFFFSRRISMTQLFKTKFNQVYFFFLPQVCVSWACKETQSCHRIG